MTTLWDRIQAATKAALTAWQGQTLDSPSAPISIYSGLADPDKRRVERYHLFWKYYRGEHRKHLKVRQTPVGPGPDDNVIVNVSRRAVTKGAMFLFGEPLGWELSEGETTPDEDLLDSIWRGDEWKMAFLSEVAINGGVTGDAYIQIQTRQNDLPRLVNLNPSIVFPHTNPGDIDETWAYELRWRSGQAIKRTMHALAESGQQWEIFTETLQQGRWVADGDAQVWPWEFPAIVHIKNLPNPNEYFGLSDLEDADLNDAINQVSSNLNRIIRLFAHPIIWGRNMGNADLDPAKIAMSSSPDALMDALELAKDLGSAQEYLKYLRTMWSEVTQVPENDPDRMTIGAQSGFALKVLFHELVQKTNIKRSLYGQGIVEVNRRLLAIEGRGDEHVCKLIWSDALPVDKREVADADRFEIEAGLVSKETKSREHGYDWDTESEKMSAERASVASLGEELLRSFERGGERFSNGQVTQ
jgi:hypothetical protein